MRLPLTTLLTCLGALTAGCSSSPNSDAGLAPQPQLERDFSKEPVRWQLARVSAVDVQLRCDIVTKRVAGIFKFSELDGRAPVSVVGQTPCTQPGNLFHWTAGEVFARENYRAALIDAQVTDLLSKAAVRPTVVARDTTAAEQVVEKFSAGINALLDPMLVEFTCPRMGAAYRFKVSGQHVERAFGEVNTRCTAANANFVVMISDVYATSSQRIWVDAYNGVKTEAIVSAFGDFVGIGKVVDNFQ